MAVWNQRLAAGGGGQIEWVGEVSNQPGHVMINRERERDGGDSVMMRIKYQVDANRGSG